MAHAEDHEFEHSHHIIPLKVLLSVFGALLFLTVLTVAVAYVPLGPLEIPVALAIAAVKASLVVMFFMALRYDKKVNTLVFATGTIFVVVFMIFTLFDTVFRGDMTDMLTPGTISEQERVEEQLRERDPGQAGLRIAPAHFPGGDTTAADTTAGDTTAVEAPEGEDGE